MAKKHTIDPSQTDVFAKLSAEKVVESYDPRDNFTKKDEKVQASQRVAERCSECIFQLTCGRNCVIIDHMGRCSEFVVNDPSGIYFVRAILECYKDTGKQVNFGKNLATSKELAKKLSEAMTHYKPVLSWPGVRINEERK